MPDNSLMPLHKRYAITGKVPDEGNFGVEPFDATHKAQSEPAGGRKALRKDGQRAIGKARGFHPEPDHGPVD